MSIEPSASVRAERTATVVAFSSASRSDAETSLILCGWDVEKAVNLIVEHGGSLGAQTSTRPDGRGDLNGSSVASYGGSSFVDDGVRAPSASVVDQLLPHSAGNIGGYGSAPQPRMPQLHTAFRDFDAEKRARIGVDGGSTRSGQGFVGGGGFAALLRPPTEMIFPGTFEAMRAAGRTPDAARWLLVNIQVDDDFDSWRLNRDVWRDETLREVVATSFLFWQQHLEFERAGGVIGASGAAIMEPNPIAVDFCRRYSLGGANASDHADFPVICIIDPRSGELLHKHTGFIEAGRLTELLSDWAAAHSLDSDAAIEPSESSSRRGVRSAAPPRTSAAKAAASALPAVGELSEDEQLRLAVAASLESAVATDTARGSAAALTAAAAARSKSLPLSDASSVYSLEFSGEEDPASVAAGASSAAGESVAAGKRPRGEAEEDVADVGAAKQRRLEPPPPRAPPVLADLPPEPPVPASGAPAQARLLVTLPSGSRHTRRFHASEPVAALFPWVAALLGIGHPVADAHADVVAAASSSCYGVLVAETSAAQLAARLAVLAPRLVLAGSTASPPSATAAFTAAITAAVAVASAAVAWDVVRPAGGRGVSCAEASCQSFSAAGLTQAHLRVRLGEAVGD